MDPQIKNQGLAKEGHGFGIQSPATIQCFDGGGGAGYIPPNVATKTVRTLGAKVNSPQQTTPAILVPPPGAVMLVVVCGQPLLYCVGDPNFGAYTKAPPGVTRIPCTLSDRNGSVDTAIYFETDDAPIFPVPDDDDVLATAGDFDVDTEQFAFSFEMLA